MVRKSPPRARRCVANEWRSACGVALSGRPSAPRIRAIASCTMRGDKGTAFRADEQRAGGLEREGAKRQIVLDRLANRRNDRRRARLLALADNRDGVRFAGRRVSAPDRERLRDAQARAVTERQHGGVARQHPGFARLAVAQSGRGHRPWRPSGSRVGAGDAPPWARGPPRAPRRFPRLRARYGGRVI